MNDVIPSPEPASPAETPPPEAEAVSVPVEELRQKADELKTRIEKGKLLIQEYRDKHTGTDNFTYIQHLQKLKREYEQIQRQLQNTHAEPLSFQESIQRKAIQTFQELVDMTLRREYDTPRYLEQEEAVRKYIREYEDLFEVLYDFAGTLH